MVGIENSEDEIEIPIKAMGHAGDVNNSVPGYQLHFTFIFKNEKKKQNFHLNEVNRRSFYYLLIHLRNFKQDIL